METWKICGLGELKHIGRITDLDIKKMSQEILERRRSNQKIKLSDEGETGPSGRMHSWGMSNFLPEIFEVEDNLTIKNYQRIINEQHNYPAHKQNGALVNRLIKKTFPHMWQVLVKDLIKLSELFQISPILCNEEQVSIFNIVALSKIKVAK